MIATDGIQTIANAPRRTSRLVRLTEAEIGLIREALDSYEYWEHRDELPHNSGHITILDDQDFEAQVYLSGRYGEDEVEAKEEAWEAVKAARALDSKLS